MGTYISVGKCSNCFSSNNTCKSSKDQMMTSNKLPEDSTLSQQRIDSQQELWSNKTGNQQKLTVDDFIFLKTLGQGSFGKVCLVQHKITLKQYAMKKIRKSEITQQGQAENIQFEKYILQSSQNTFIVKLKYAFQNSQKIYLVMEYVSGGELYQHLKKLKKFNQHIAVFYLAEIILALEYIHQKRNVIYRDLKPENILLDEDGHAKLIDFGLSKTLVKQTTSFCGTAEYMAPEIILQQPYDKSADYWSLGCLAYELVVGKPPFQDLCKKNIYQKILRNKPYYPAYLSHDICHFIKSLLKINPSTRLGAHSFEQIKTHSIFSKIDWQALQSKKIQSDTPSTSLEQLQFENFSYQAWSELPEQEKKYDQQ